MNRHCLVCDILAISGAQREVQQAMSALSFVALELQTTHLNPASVSQASYVKLVNGNVTLVNSWPVIPPTANGTAPHGSSQQTKTWSEALSQLTMMVGTLPIVSYYRDADKEVFQAASRHIGETPPEFHWLDCRELAKRYLPDLPEFQLSTVLESLDLLPEYGDSDSVEQTSQIVLELARRHDAGSIEDLWGDLYDQPDKILGIEAGIEGLNFIAESMPFASETTTEHLDEASVGQSSDAEERIVTETPVEPDAEPSVHQDQGDDSVAAFDDETTHEKPEDTRPSESENEPAVGTATQAGAPVVPPAAELDDPSERFQDELGAPEKPPAEVTQADTSDSESVDEVPVFLQTAAAEPVDEPTPTDGPETHEEVDEHDSAESEPESDTSAHVRPSSAIETSGEASEAPAEEAAGSVAEMPELLQHTTLEPADVPEAAEEPESVDNAADLDPADPVVHSATGTQPGAEDRTSPIASEKPADEAAEPTDPDKNVVLDQPVRATSPEARTAIPTFETVEVAERPVREPRGPKKSRTIRTLGFVGVFGFGLLTIVGLVLTVMAGMLFFTDNALMLETKIAGIILTGAITLLSLLMTTISFTSFRDN